MSVRKTIICFAGGTSGDLAVSVLDPRNCTYDTKNGRIKIAMDRAGMKKFWKYNDVETKIQYIKQAFAMYDSLPSHDVDFHLANNHQEVIGITCFDENLREKSAIRFKDLHRSEVWDSLPKVCKTETVQQYSDDILQISRKLERAFTTIDLSEIIKGDLISRFTGLGYEIGRESVKIYNDWLAHHSGENLSPK